MLDMSKAFDSMDRQTLINELRNIIDADELHILASLLNVTLSVKCGETLSEEFHTGTTRRLWFTFYFAKAMPSDESWTSIHDHGYSLPISIPNIAYHLNDHCYSITTQKGKSI